MTIDTRNTILSVVLGIIIIFLGWILVRSIVLPYQEVEEREAMTERVRERMLNVRDALIRYERENEQFPPTEGGLDSLMTFVRTDSTMQAVSDSLFQAEPSHTFKLDSLIYSPRTPHEMFEYTLNDTINPPIYLLKDPATDDKIGSVTTTTMRNSPNW